MDPLDLLIKMCSALDDRADDVAEAVAWYEGNHPVPPPPPNTFPAVDTEARRAFETMSRLAVTNMLPPIVDTPASKMRVEGFRFSASPTTTDQEAWAIWQRNYLDADGDLATFTALQTGQVFALVWPGADGLAQITVEDPSQCLVMYAPGSRRTRAAGLKRWVADDGKVWVTLYTPQAIYKYASTMSADELRRHGGNQRSVWEARRVAGEPWPLPNSYGFVPLVEGRVNAGIKATPFGGGRPEFAKQINLQRQINSNTMNLLTTMEHQAFRQRWIIGWEPPTTEGGALDRHALLKAAASDLWVLNNSDALDNERIRTGEFSQADFRPFIDVNRELVKAMASTSQTPPYAFLLGDMVNVAADSIARIDGQQSNKVRAHCRNLGEFFEEVLRMALKVEGNPKAADTATSVVWGDVEGRTATEQMGVAKDLRALGAPDQAVFAAVPDVDQQEAARWATQRTAAALINRAATR